MMAGPSPIASYHNLNPSLVAVVAIAVLSPGPIAEFQSRVRTPAIIWTSTAMPSAGTPSRVAPRTSHPKIRLWLLRTKVCLT
jgi:hypothetical protein